MLPRVSHKDIPRWSDEEDDEESAELPGLCHSCWNHWLLEGCICPACEPSPDDLLIRCGCGSWRYFQSACTSCHVPLCMWPSNAISANVFWIPVLPMHLHLSFDCTSSDEETENASVGGGTPTIFDAFLTPLQIPIILQNGTDQETTAFSNVHQIYLPIVFYLQPDFQNVHQG